MKSARDLMYLFLKIQPKKTVSVMEKWSMKMNNQLPLQLWNLIVCSIYKTFKIIQCFFFCVDKYISQWNTRLTVNIAYRNRRNFKDIGKVNNGK
jgi:phenylacetate-coenzyme A ligase PaaK-like adenylate-forming protein